MVALPILGLVTAHVNLLFSLNFLKINPWWYAKIRMLFFLLFIIRSILPTNLAASSGLSTFLDKSSMPSRSTSSLISLFCYFVLFFAFHHLSLTKIINCCQSLCQFCSNFVLILFRFCELSSYQLSFCLLLLYMQRNI